jgi:feruloyl-CoA synthase
VIGLPLPGTEILLTPNGNKQELRVRGPNVTPGYWRRPDLTQDAFDTEGFYRIGDAGKMLDPADPAKGIVFDGRVAEDFKLMSGTWVHSGALRVAAIGAGAPLIQDCVVAGHDREEIALLIFLNPPACAGLSQDAIRARLAEGLNAYNSQNPGNSTRIARAIILAVPPAIDANEITDKGYINQRAVLEHRKDMVERLYAPLPDPDVIVLA